MNTIVTISYTVVFLLLAIAIWRVDRKSRRRLAARHAAFIRSTLPPAKAVRETEPGFNLALQDECELLINDPEFAARCDQLWQAIRDEQQKGEQT